MIYLPDTNAVSAYLRGDHPGLTSRMQREFPRLRLSVLVVAEREFGFVNGPTAARQRPKFETLRQLVPTEPFTAEDANTYAQVRSTLEKRGQGIGPIDTLIAAQCLRLGATLVTRNVAEFARVPGLKVENWQD